MGNCMGKDVGNHGKFFQRHLLRNFLFFRHPKGKMDRCSMTAERGIVPSACAFLGPDVSKALINHEKHL